jgi:hypothetical protein
MRHRIELSGRRAWAWRPTGQRGWGLLRSILTSYLALGVTLYILPGRQSSGPLAVFGLVIAVAAVGLLLRPLLAGLAVVFGSVGLLLFGVLSQAIILDVAIALAPDVDIGGNPEVLSSSRPCLLTACLLTVCLLTACLLTACLLSAARLPTRAPGRTLRLPRSPAQTRHRPSAGRRPTCC